MAAHIFRLSGEYEYAIALINKAMRLQPYVSSLYVIKLGMNYYCISRYKEAKDTAEKFRRMSQIRGKGIVWVAYLMLAMDYMRLNWRGLGGSAVHSSLAYSPHIPPYFFMPLSYDILPFILLHIIRSSRCRCDCSCSMLFLSQ